MSAYRGRFAPTPSGPLHLGSLLTALAGFLAARAAGGAWLLRIDDLDAPRCPPGAADAILRQLEAHALLWDEAPRYQSQHRAEYEAARDRLVAAGATYACSCTRAVLARDASPGPDGPVYAGTCRGAGRSTGALRFAVGTGRCCLDDAGQGRVCRDLAREIGDFVVWRADGVPGYPLACVVDEQTQGITEVVRGVDLLGSSLRQIELLARLGQAAPRYRHLPVLVDGAGRKLSKQNHAGPVLASQASANLARCLDWLGQDLPPALRLAPPAEIVAAAIRGWTPGRLPAGTAIPVE